jgi:hypothetical protein
VSYLRKILVTAVQLDQTRGEFTASELVVQTWLRFPGAFGLPGYVTIYPDANRVFAKLSGKRGLVGRGWLEALSTRRYRVTQAGREAADAMIRVGR